MTKPSEEPQRFFEALWTSLPEGGRILIWTLQNKTSHWARTTEEAAALVAAAEGKGFDIYTGMGLSPDGFNSKQRCPADKVLAIPGLWIDIDFADPTAHKKGQLPPSLEDINLSGTFPASMAVSTGHGVHLYWIFKEPWIFDSDAERAEAAKTTYGWNAHFQDVLLKQGYELDQVGDLARIMRVPGTTNHKGGAGIKAIILFSNNHRYNPTDFEEYQSSPLQPNNTHVLPIQKDASPTTIILDPSANPPFDKFQALLENLHQFKQSWERTKKGMKDTSPSAWDFSLSSQASKAGWTDQEITNLLIASRRKHGDDLKLRVDYYIATLTRSRSAQEKEDAGEKLEVADQTGASVEQQLSWASQIVGIKIVGLTKFTSEPAEYRLITMSGGIRIGEIKELMCFGDVRCKIAEQTGTVVPRMKGDQWDKVVQALLLSCKTESVGKEATDTGSVESWLSSYLSEYKVIDCDEDSEKTMKEAVAAGAPYWKGGITYINGGRFRTWLAVRVGERLTAKRMGVLLRTFGAKDSVVMIEVNGKMTSRNQWGFTV